MMKASEKFIQALEEKIQKQLESHNLLFLRKVKEILANNFEDFKRKFEELKLKHKDDLTKMKKQMSEAQEKSRLLNDDLLFRLQKSRGEFDNLEKKFNETQGLVKDRISFEEEKYRSVKEEADQYKVQLKEAQDEIKNLKKEHNEEMKQAKQEYKSDLEVLIEKEKTQASEHAKLMENRFDTIVEAKDKEIDDLKVKIQEYEIQEAESYGFIANLVDLLRCRKVRAT